MTKIMYRFNTVLISKEDEAFKAFIMAFRLIITPEVYYSLAKELQKYWIPYESDKNGKSHD